MVTKISKWSRIQDSCRITPKIESPVAYAMPDTPSKFQRDPSITFWVILLTDRQTDKQTKTGKNITSLAEVKICCHVLQNLANQHTEFRQNLPRKTVPLPISQGHTHIPGTNHKKLTYRQRPRSLWSLRQRPSPAELCSDRCPASVSKYTTLTFQAPSKFYSPLNELLPPKCWFLAYTLTSPCISKRVHHLTFSNTHHIHIWYLF